ncbi:unnamed protein product [Staurois parvus]|uniref:Uncharacterized protein n=1 Tax=Staurois parvus TaxID=386267 RepID=A0ABN9D5Q4_9NEOB|nr:unnamed protein product [Staurois parvus]
MLVNASNHVHKHLSLENFLNSSISRCCPKPFFIMKNACKAFSRYSNGPGTQYFEVLYEKKIC